MAFPTSFFGSAPGLPVPAMSSFSAIGRRVGSSNGWGGRWRRRRSPELSGPTIEDRRGKLRRPSDSHLRGRTPNSMKVLLISANTTNAPHSVYPLGLDYVAGALAPRHEVRILDMNRAASHEHLEAEIRDYAPGLIGISIRNIDNVDTLAAKSFIPGYERIVQLLRGCTRAPICVGGS